MSKKLKVTEQRFNAIKRQLKVKANTKESVAERHGLKVSTIKFISGCKDYATYRGRSTGKEYLPVDGLTAYEAVNSFAQTVNPATAPVKSVTAKLETKKPGAAAKYAQDLLEARTEAESYKNALAISKKHVKELQAEVDAYRTEEIRRTVAKARAGRSLLARFRRAA
ncbi:MULTISPECIES: hypothetical protein [Arthrobacter]|uniref:Uncharacterized protein n=1 Tax=Arthrobacter terricola TaxID=2547396 RepID=A0A4R5KJJ8_9MICC|nr:MULTISPECIES: hypothetical protein [Arthrobacter]MBT8161433.1 hypothetical protein [Arthrobacter sp. GN70]TDF95606.1 hypothetical protein E1809_11305 [Arthrobacter terricola]